MKTIEEIKSDAQWMRIRLLELARQAGANGSHIGGALSSVDILATIYGIANTSVRGVTRDRVILSKGHAAMALYCILERNGVLTKEEVDSFETNGTHYFSHVSRNTEKGIEFSGGSLGLGLSYAVGAALSCQQHGVSNHIYVLLGDGECDEGIIWEALMSLKNLHLTNMTIVVDCNGLQADGNTKDVLDISPLAEKFMAFGLHVSEVDGHNIEELYKTLQFLNNEKSHVILAHSVKGKGISFLENQPSSHHCVINQKKYETALAELTK